MDARRRPIEPSLRWERAPGWLWRRLRASVLVLGQGDAYRSLTGAAAVVWLLLDVPSNLGELCDAAAELGAEGDVEVIGEAVTVLADAGLVRPAHGEVPR